jgi:hypothetical protein
VLPTQHDFFAEVLDLHHDLNLEVRAWPLARRSLAPASAGPAPAGK